jgi:hypothetical protein
MGVVDSCRRITRAFSGHFLCVLPNASLSCDNQHLKRSPVNRSDRVGRSFELGSRVTDASDLHPKKQDSQITSTDEGCESMSNRSHQMYNDRTAILLCQNQTSQMRKMCIHKSSADKSLHNKRKSRNDSDNGDSSTEHCRTFRRISLRVSRAEPCRKVIWADFTNSLIFKSY